MLYFFFFSSRRRHTRYWRDWSSDVCSSDLFVAPVPDAARERAQRRRAERALGLRGRRDVREPAPLRRAREPRGQTLARVAGVVAYAARLVVYVRAREVRRRAFAEARGVSVRASPSGYARAGERRLKDGRALVEPDLRRALVRRRREREQALGRRARALQSLALRRFELNRDDPHHRLRRAARRGDGAEQ